MRSELSLPLGAARTERPHPPFRITFDHFIQRFHGVPRTDPFPIIPIEAVQPGDGQVLASRELPGLSTPVIDLDVLADFPSVESVVASTQIRASRDLPHLRELLLTHNIRLPDAVTMRHLTGLRTLFALPVAGANRLDLESLPAAQMEHLAVSHWFTKSLAPLEKMTGLVKLKADVFRDSLDGVARMARLKYLHILGPAKGWAKLRECPLLEEAHFIDVQISNLHRWNTWKDLRVLVLSGRGVKSLAGLENCQALEDLTLLNLSMDDLAPLRELPRLASLTLRMVAKRADLVSVAKIPNLRSLVIEDAAVSDEVMLSTIRPLAAATSLEELTLLQTIIEDGDLMPLADLPKLRKLRLGSRIGGDIEKLRAARPDLEIHHTPPDPRFEALKEVSGAVTILKPGEGVKVWSIFQSFAPALGLQNNYDAERRIKNEIKKKFPEVAKRLDWDTEAGAVGIYADTEADIRIVAGAINELLQNVRQ